MSASTITRSTLVDDTGTAAAPVGDGTVLNNALWGSSIYDKIDQMFAGGGSYATFTFGGLIAAEGFGTNAFTAGGTGGNIVRVRNTTAGTGNYSEYQLGNDANAVVARLRMSSSTFTAGTVYKQDGFTLDCERAGGLTFAATHASGAIDFWTGGTAAANKRVVLNAAGSLLLSDGTSSDLAWSFQNDTNTGLYRSAADTMNVLTGGATRILVESTSATAGKITFANTKLAIQVGTATTLAGNQNDYAFAGSVDAFLYRIQASAPINITGVSASGTSGEMICIVNIGAQNITFTNEDAGSSAQNRVISPTGGSFVLAANDAIWLVYDVTSTRWRIVATAT